MKLKLKSTAAARVEVTVYFDEELQNTKNFSLLNVPSVISALTQKIR
jgi:hypothetical protein